MKLGYEKLMEENNIEEKDLSKDLIVVIREVKQLKSIIQSKRNIGQTPTPETMSKLRFKDKWIVNELLDYIEDSDEDDDDDSDDTDQDTDQNLADDSDDDDSDDDEDDDSDDDASDDDDNDEIEADGVLIDSELIALLNSGKSTITFTDLKNLAPETEKLIFQNYEPNSENGIITTNFSLIETAQNSEIFKISKL
jgi:hypothetical protein